MPETETEFMGYTGDCVWAAVHMGAHRLAPDSWPIPNAETLDQLTREAIAAGIGVGSAGQATPGQLKTMLSRWGMVYTIGHDYDSSTVSAQALQAILDPALARGKPVILGFTNGQALTGDEVGLHGHEIVVLHPLTPAGYPSGDGDNPLCRIGELVYYPLEMLERAAPDSAFVLEEVPGMALDIARAANWFMQQADGSWKCKLNGYVLAQGMLERYRTMPSGGTLAGMTELGLPLSNILYQPQGGCAIQVFERGILVWDPQRKLDNPPGVIGDYYLAHIDSPKLNPILAAAESRPAQQDTSPAAALALAAVKALTAAQGAQK